jgi:outer membrane lipoprotein-sorting protein
MRAICVLAFLLPAIAASKAKKSDPFREVETVMAKYRAAPAIKAKVKKTVVQEVMGMESVSEGEFFFSKGKLRLEISKPDVSLLVYDGKTVWVESRMDENTIQVTKLRANELKRSKSVLTALFGKKDILKGFKLIKSSNKDGVKTFVFEPKDKKPDSEVQQLELRLKSKDLEMVSYKDQLENEVKFEFQDLTRGEVPAAKFSYKPPKNAEVTEI